MVSGQHGGALDMVAVAVCREDAGQGGPSGVQLCVKGLDVLRVADSGVHQRRVSRSSDEEVCVIAAAGHRTGVSRVEANGRQSQGDRTVARLFILERLDKRPVNDRFGRPQRRDEGGSQDRRHEAEGDGHRKRIVQSHAGDMHSSDRRTA